MVGRFRKRISEGNAGVQKMITLKFIKRVPSAESLVKNTPNGNIHRKQNNRNLNAQSVKLEGL